MGTNNVTQLTLRLPEDLHNKIRIIAAYKTSSINAVAVGSLSKTVQEWEQKNGSIVIPEE
jgi:HicB family.